jgi:hypothetical protein
LTSMMVFDMLLMRFRCFFAWCGYVFSSNGPIDPAEADRQGEVI